MNVAIKEKVASEHGLTLTECLFLLFSIKGGDVRTCIKSLIEKGWASEDLFDDTRIVVGDTKKEELSTILVESENCPVEMDFSALADKMREIYPKGRKEGTTYMWRDTTAVIAKKLKILVTKYGAKFTEKEAIEATQNYVNSFKGNYKYMQLLKYFILKTPVNANGDTEIKSEFLSYIDNAGEIEKERGDWTTTLR